MKKVRRNKVRVQEHRRNMLVGICTRGNTHNYLRQFKLFSGSDSFKSKHFLASSNGQAYFDVKI